ncbi:MAG: terminase small subunit [Cyanobacteria bacterium J06576_12]
MSKLSEQQEKFCRNIVEGMSQTDAYEAAGYKGDRKSLQDNASRLIGNDRIIARIEQLRKDATEDTEVTLQWLIEQAVGVLSEAREDGSHAASIAAIKELGVLTGERVEKRQNENTNRDAAEYSRAELLAIAKGGGKGASAKRPSARELN